MHDLIERQAAIDAIYALQKDGCIALLDCAVDEVKNLPSAQPEIVRCKDCKWKQGAECVRFADVRPFADDFCSRAERRTDG